MSSAKKPSSATVTFFKKAFVSNYVLGKTILHEYFHVADTFSGYSKLNYLKLRKSHSLGEASQLLKLDSETRAYDFVFKLGAPSSVLTPARRRFYGF